MDILKVLSRGTKKSHKPAAGLTPQLPSAGAQANPQLYHDPIRGQKRKRNTEQAETKVVAEELPEVDFFAPKTENTVKKAPKEPTTREKSPVPDPATRVQLSEDECRQLLRSHRLKVSLLSKHEDDSRVNKPKKKKSKKDKEPEKTKKDAKKQLTPQPLSSFAELRSVYGISRRVAENLVTEGYRVPTEIQLGCLPLLLRPELALKDEAGLDHGVDLLAVAPTGSGKTVSFLLPVFNNIMRRRAQAKVQGVHELEAIIVAPTRELVHQIATEGRKLLDGTGLRIVGMKKRMNIASEKQEIIADSSEGEEDGDESESDDEAGNAKKTRAPKPVTKTDILVTTPLLLLNFLQSGPDGTQRVLPTVRDLVLDEADVLLDPLFRAQTLGLWAACTDPNMRLTFWSATMGSNIESLVTEQLEARAKELGTVQKPLVRVVVGLKDTAVPNITHKLTYTASEQGKLLALRQLLHPRSSIDDGPPLRPPFLVFTQTIERATALLEELKYDIPLEAGGSTRIAALHSGLADSARAGIMRKFRAGEIWVLITTDVLARGVDFAGVNGVVNYDVPGSSAAYVHRAGRTGRAGREGGIAVTLYTKEDIPFVKTVANVIAASERQAGRTGDDAEIKKWLLDALPDVNKNDRKMLREKGVEARRTGKRGAEISTKSGWERKRDHNRKGAAEGSKKRKMDAKPTQRTDAADQGEWGGFDD